MPTSSFLRRWQDSAAAERANYQLFLSELCDFLEVPQPNPAVGDNRHDQYVFEAYGWPPDLSGEEILFRLVDCNAARAAEERSGLIRWLRPEFQKTAATQTGMEVGAEEAEPRAARAVRPPVFPRSRTRGRRHSRNPRRPGPSPSRRRRLSRLNDSLPLGPQKLVWPAVLA